MSVRLIKDESTENYNFDVLLFADSLTANLLEVDFLQPEKQSYNADGHSLKAKDNENVYVIGSCVASL